MKSIDMAGRKIGVGLPCFIVAEAGVNHNGQIELARQLVDAAAAAGADAVKFQVFQAEKLVAPSAPKASYQREAGAFGESQLQMLKKLELPLAAFRDLEQYCRQKRILFLATPFDEQSSDFLEQLPVAGFKVSSCDLTHLGFLDHLARKGKPLLVSTGMANQTEVEAAVRAIRETGNDQVALLHCVSKYPAAPAEANLRAMATLAQAFDLPVGFSDHTPGLEVALAAVALGACVIEKHFTISRGLPGPDHRASLEPDELGSLVRGIRNVEAALGHGRKEPVAGEAEVAGAARRSLVCGRRHSRRYPHFS